MAALGRRRLLGGLAFGLAAPALRAQPAWPTRPVRIVVAYAPGGGTDITSRAFAEAFGHRFGQSFVVENRPGANGVVGTEAVARAPADGYTLLAVTSTHVMNRQMVNPLPFDPATDFTPIGLMARYPLVLMLNVDAPFQDLAGLLAYARAHPGELAQATSDAQSSYTANRFAQAAGLELTEVPYRGSGAYLGDLTGGHLKLAWGSPATAMGLLPGGRIKIIAVSSPQRSSTLPDVPTLREAGVPEVEFDGWFGLFGPAKLPEAITRQLNTAMTEISATPAMQARLRSLAVDPAPMDLPALAATLVREEQVWAEAARAGLLPKP
ncbi:MAG TPA: tripartite tricarboxylate transporter substrate binding protein [Acetobacteraceae bacterium]|jgi:tripartite-type tricarboxylate transporter receptor subunit TctC